MTNQGTGKLLRGTAAAPPADRPAPLLRIESVVKRFGGVTAVDRLSLDVAAGEFFALLGPSGCGKTTLLRMLAGFETPDEGRILLDGRDVADVLPHRRPVNMMFQSYALFPHLSVRDNIAFGLKRAGLEAAEIAARVKEMVALVGLEGLERRKPDQLSGGQRQRVALARALARRPRILLLDEPLAALDKKLRERTQAELLALQRRLGTTFIIVTHDQDEAMTMADRIGVMDHGGLVQVASPRELYEAPNCRWIAGFFGDVNLFEGEVSTQANGRLTLASREAGAIVAVDHGGSPRPAGLSVAVRPEKIRLTAPGAAPIAAAENRLSGEIHEVDYRGGASIYRVGLPGGFVLRAALVNASRLAADQFAPGEAVIASFAASDCVVLER
ncbi:ABC transporter ATP-binding protein [Bradyrhizobium sp. WD16]|uniref:ABC transporter ATP-binding protein n=1 Tax=Bradyrhizobium sp. WD16 TaxID=1521768 RepID=UPI0020A538FF|nr:ABC transporter ATP-binding protein [Bradyrhizobium sp. WD16]UTD26301.1 polyamine ABC transporter ATP-binding protein [Bradyrhizobium sp. WD16]